MKDSLLLGLGRDMIPIPRMVWERVVKADARRTRAGLSFMSEDHHRVRDFAVLELPRTGAPLAPESIAEELDLAVPRVCRFWKSSRRISPSCSEATTGGDLGLSGHRRRTPHHASFSTGEEAYSP